MNKKGNTAWILCSSKSFPGKLYYFNVTTGEAAWCLTEEEKKAVAKDAAVKKVSDKSHFYPEPNTPPNDYRPDTPNFRYNFTPPPNIPVNYHNALPQMFSQPLLSQYMPGYVIPMPQMFVPNKEELKKRTFDQLTQTSDDQATDIQGYTIPLSKRFGTYRQVNTHTKTIDNKGIYALNQNTSKTERCKENFGTVQGSVFGPKLNDLNIIGGNTRGHVLIPFNNNNATKTYNTRIIKDPVLSAIKTKENNRINDFTINNNNQMTNVSQKLMPGQDTDVETENSEGITAHSSINTEIGDCLRKPAFHCQYSTTMKDNCLQNTKRKEVLKEPLQKLTSNDQDVSTMNEINKIGKRVENSQEHLNSNDLRLVLQAKRRQRKSDSMFTTAQNGDIFSSTSQHYNNGHNKFKETAKHVTFNFGNLREAEREIDTPTGEETYEPESGNIMESNSPPQQALNISYFKSLANSIVNTDPWYVVVDIGVLLSDFDFIEDFVKKDITCRLVVPNSVRSYIETMSIGEYGGRSWVLLARKAMRRMDTQGQHIVLQPPIMEKCTTSAIDGTIECCLQALKCNHAVLITTDSELYNKAVLSGIYTYKLADVKRSVENEPQITFNMGIKVNFNNDNIINENTDNLEAFSPSTSNVSTRVNINPSKSLECNRLGPSNYVLSERSNVVIETMPTDKIKLNRRKINFNTDVNSTVEDDRELRSIHDNWTQNNKMSDNFKGISHKYSDFNIRKVIINTNIHKTDIKEDKKTLNFNPEHERRLSKEIVLNPAIDSGNGLAQVTSSSDFGTKAQPLTITVPVRPQTTNFMKEGNRLKMNSDTKDDLLLRFHVKNRDMGQRIDSRLDEWTCCFYQIMEECLNDILMKKIRGTQTLSAPWSLLEAVLCLQKVYSDNAAIKAVADKLCNILDKLSHKDGKLKNNTTSDDFMKLFGCGVLMVESLKSLLPQSAEVLESEVLLKELLHRMEEPSTDLELPYTPTRGVRSELDDVASLNRKIVPKKASDIIGYLKIHFPAWKDFDERHLSPEYTTKQIKVISNGCTVVRTDGKNLNSVKISKAKQITFDKIPLNNTVEIKDIESGVQKDMPEITRIVDNVQTATDKVNTKEKFRYNDSNKRTGKISSTYDKNKIKVIENYNNATDLMGYDEALDYEESAPNCSNFAEDVTREIDFNATLINDEMNKNNEALHTAAHISFDEINDKIAQGDGNKDNYDATNDSGFENQSLDTCSFIRLFLAELSASFKLIYNFIDDSIQEFRSDMAQVGHKKHLYDKANETHLYVADIIGKLRRIVDREASENTRLKSLIMTAGVDALSDKRMTRYRQVTMKCLEQAQLLEAALKTVLALTNEHCDITALDAENAGGHVTYLNIFE